MDVTRVKCKHALYVLYSLSKYLFFNTFGIFSSHNVYMTKQMYFVYLSKYEFKMLCVCMLRIVDFSAVYVFIYFQIFLYVM